VGGEEIGEFRRDQRSKIKSQNHNSKIPLTPSPLEKGGIGGFFL
jgi:hypothetical protein